MNRHGPATIARVLVPARTAATIEKCMAAAIQGLFVAARSMRLSFQPVREAEQCSIEPQLAPLVQFDHLTHQTAR
ncbi:hypothetical protein DSM25559_5181 [Agrobacterium rosae]|uniref:Uncharacterized protein n=1 Tax=Agrobacterium rosae TaxID=1972867 RepID=A0A1R3U4Q5_9HYPH|nr:hypothetical protein DSM25559_5181 [Agrobacterium rosae]